MWFYKTDPDVIVGHEFLGSSLDILLHRLKQHKLQHWSRLSRFRRKKWPNVGKQGSNIKFLAGRMLCDLTSDGAKVWRLFAFVFSWESEHASLEHDSVDYVVFDGDVQDAFEE